MGQSEQAPWADERAADALGSLPGLVLPVAHPSGDALTHQFASIIELQRDGTSHFRTRKEVPECRVKP